MTSRMLTNLRKFGYRGLFVDCTHNTTRYDFKLAIVMIINDYGIGVPVAFYFCKSESVDDLRPLFHHLKMRYEVDFVYVCSHIFNSRCEFQGCRMLLTDDTHVFRNAFFEYFDSVNCKWLVCMWHVLRNWKKNCVDKIDGAANRRRMFLNLYALIQYVSIVHICYRHSFFCLAKRQENRSIGDM